MSSLEERLCESMRQYENLYNPSMRLYSDKPAKVNSWREISRNLNTDTDIKETCRRFGTEADIQKHSLQTAQNLLQEDVVRAEEQSEDLLEKFMEGNVPLEGFLDSFQSSRKSYHIRRAQAEKIQELNRAKRNSSKPKKPEDKMRDEKPEPQRTNGFMAQGPPRVFQLRYGLTPAILLPHFPLPSSSTTPPSALTHTSLPPLDSQPGQTQILSPSAPLSGHGHPVNLRVIGQLPGGWSTRPMRLQQLYRPAPHQPEPPYR
ncbi:vacuolar protein sorting-associated protein 37D isoform X2 [Oncorhynchus kisutch]|uniref:vacuolar protein sorting-associated protein 37D isoform X2 n=1 Tax=Oncorhynchus kisutch TaxID=8019 RepID=UPI00099FDCF7|nr:vacuolar protein sorting-associated protein 37D isoform X2 [Oncorhynchus kisutch]